MSKRFFVVLGVSPGADLSQIRSAYRQLVKVYKPDLGVHPSVAEESVQIDDEEDAAPLTLDRSSRPSAVARKARSSAGRPSTFSELDDFLDGWVPGFFRGGRQETRKKDLYVELVLAPSEAMAGGMIPLKIPVEHPCPECGGVVSSEVSTCDVCQGRGTIVEYRDVEIAIPPGVVDGTRVKIDLRDVGLPATDLHVLVTIE